MRIAIAGGHFSPALAVINELSKEDEVIVLGREYTFEGEKTHSFEYLVCQEKGIRFENIRAGRLQRRLTKHTLSALLRSPVGFFDAHKALRNFKPDVVLCFGGYVSLPIALAARFLNIPIVLHEQTQDASLSNKSIGAYASKICISFESSAKYFPKDKIVLTGNPIPKESLEIKKELSLPKGKIVYVTGGSGGSHFLNSMVEESLEDLLVNYVVIHQTGDSEEFKDYDKLDKKRSTLPKDLQERYILRKFVFSDEAGFFYKNSDLVVSRSGINTVTILLALGKMSFLVPLPHGQKGEQLANAKLIKKIGIGDFEEQNVLSPQIFVEKIRLMFQNHAEYETHKEEAKKYFYSDAAKRIVDVISSLNLH